MIMKPNRLIKATSPYLLQHALNPVDWFEWNEEALTKAQQENKPILVSIGYSSCHWCHVMEKQSFENEDIAALMNEFFVCIKVDREERPDIDQVYMEAVQAMGANGGWPLNVFLTPDQKPFFGGTYFSPKAWAQVLININKAYNEKRDQVLASAEELRNILASNDIERFKQQNAINDLKQEIEQAYQSTAPKFDKTWGGIDKAPKFIMPSVWQWMLRYYNITKNEEALTHLNLTLKRILYGGIYDQVGGGFARYSVDREWFAPHFEKMLYDNAQLLSLYAEAYALTKDTEYKRAVEETFDWLEREMKDTDGAYYAALDADSEGEEGKFYVWTDAELKSVLQENYATAIHHFECKSEGNWEHGNNILKRKTDSQVDEKLLNKIKSDLLTIRNKRPKPGLDDKILSGWNALTIIGLTDAYRYLQDEKYLNASKNVLAFIENKLLKENILYRSYKDKTSPTEAFLDDYAALIAAYIAMQQVTLDESYLVKAKRLTTSVLEKFFDDSDGFFFYSAKQDLI
ncbi:MAG: thioredoxin domain-containing protein, partial [Cytophagia bacterium]|nr:thioredoxin domain-containing protein [Cytophagia bacterium]